MKNSGQTAQYFNSPFEKLVEEYDSWYDKHPDVFEAELQAIKKLELPKEGRALEVGVGTGRFAEKLKIEFGVDIAFSPLKLAKKRGVLAIQADTSFLPFKNESFSAVFLITTLCFLPEPLIALKEVFRVLKKKGKIIVGFINRESPLGKEYEKKKQKSPFYKKAHFFSPLEVQELLLKAGFKNFDFAFTLNKSFCVISGDKV